MRNILRLLFILILTGTVILGQTKTEKAKEELESDDPDTENTTNSESSNGGGSCIGSLVDDSCIGSLVEITLRIGFQVAINFDFDNYTAIQPVWYNYPFQQVDNTSIRSRFSGVPSLFQTTLAYGGGYDDAITNLTAKGDWHLSGWALRFKYQYLQEQGAPYPIHYYNALVERKSAIVENCDMGISTGFGQLELDGKRYPGFLLGYNLEIFIKKPVSVFIQPSVFFPANADDTVLDRNLGFRIHHNTNYLEVRWNRFSVAAIPFNTIQLALGKYIK